MDNYSNVDECVCLDIFPTLWWREPASFHPHPVSIIATTTGKYLLENRFDYFSIFCNKLLKKYIYLDI